MLSPQVKIGLYVPHDPHVFQPIEWKYLVLNVSRLGAEEMKKELEKHGRDMKMKVRSHSTAKRSLHFCSSIPNQNQNERVGSEPQTQSKHKFKCGSL